MASVYSYLLSRLGSLTGRPILDGAIGILLGLFICAHPAANAIDLFFFDRDLRERLTSGWRGLGWLALNVLVLFCGWLVLTLGAARLAATSSWRP